MLYLFHGALLFFFFFGCFILLNIFIFVILVFMNILEEDGTSSNRAALWYAFSVCPPFH